MTKRLLVMVLAVLGVVAFLPASATASPTAPADLRMAAAGIDVATLRPGYTVSGNEVSWDNGDVRMLFGREQTGFGPTDIYDCPLGAVCLFENSNFDDQNHDGVRDGKRIIILRGRSTWQDMRWYSFDNKMSSWVNRLSTSRWYENFLPNPTPSYCMPMDWAYDVPVYAPQVNDMMSMLWIYEPGAVYC